MTDVVWECIVIWTVKVALGKILMLGATERSSWDTPFGFASANLRCHDDTVSLTKKSQKNLLGTTLLNSKTMLAITA